MLCIRYKIRGDTLECYIIKEREYIIGLKKEEVETYNT